VEAIIPKEGNDIPLAEVLAQLFLKVLNQALLVLEIFLFDPLLAKGAVFHRRRFDLVEAQMESNGP
jgi:hypothetical protein